MAAERRDEKEGGGDYGRSELRRVTELGRFVREHLTAASVMVELAPPLPAAMRALEARRYLDRNDFDLAIVDDERLYVVMRRSLRGLGRTDLSRAITELAESP